jgi:LacI family transcriptional regulator
MRRQVKKLAEELQYVPNQAAISFKQGRTCTIGVILPSLSEEFFSIAINGIEDVATGNKYTVLIGQSHDDVEREKLITETMRKHRVDGLIVSLSKTTVLYEHFEQLKQYSIPVVFFDRVPDDPQFYSVSCNLEKSSVQLVDWLVKAGHSTIGFIKGPDTMKPSQERLIGYYEGLRKNGLPINESLVVTTDLGSKQTIAAMQQLLDLPQRPSAVIAFNDYVALEAMRFTRGRGIKINQDIFFASYANLPITRYLDDPPVASVEQFPYLQAEKATSLLFRLINAGGDPEGLERKLVLESKVVLNKEG